MTTTVRIGFAVCLTLSLVHPALADQYSSIEPRYPTTPQVYPSASQHSHAAERQRTGQNDILKPPPASTVENNMLIQDLYVKRLAQAPPEEYFGRANLSIAGIGNLIIAINRAAHNCDATAAQDMAHKLVFVEGSLRDWQAKYPDDPRLPRFCSALLIDFNVLNTDMSSDPGNDAGVHAVDLASWIKALYPAAAVQ